MGVARFRLAPYQGSLVQGESVVCLPTPRSTWCPLQNTRGWSITLNGRPQFEVRKSIVVPLQLGLFAARTFRKGEIMGYLEGEGGERAEGSCLVRGSSRSEVRDASCADSGLQFANCGKGRRHNAHLGGRTVVARVAIREGDEILYGYGAGYWATEQARAGMPPR